MSFDQLTIRVQNLLAGESEVIRLMKDQDTDGILASVAYLNESRKIREAYYRMPAWQAA